MAIWFLRTLCWAAFGAHFLDGSKNLCGNMYLVFSSLSQSISFRIPTTLRTIPRIMPTIQSIGVAELCVIRKYPKNVAIGKNKMIAVNMPGL